MDNNKFKPPILLFPDLFKVYRNKNGIIYLCIGISSKDASRAVLVSEGGWMFEARYLRRYESGLIEWDWSSGGMLTDPDRYKAYFDLYREEMKNEINREKT